MSLKILFVLSALGIFLEASSYEMWESSPCPHYFRYTQNGQRGILTIPGPINYQSVDIHANVGIDSYINNIPERGIDLEKDMSYVNEDIYRGMGINLIFTFAPVQRHPAVLSITVNGRNICYQENNQYLPVWKFHYYIPLENNYNNPYNNNGYNYGYDNGNNNNGYSYSYNNGNNNGNNNGYSYSYNNGNNNNGYSHGYNHGNNNGYSYGYSYGNK